MASAKRTTGRGDSSGPGAGPTLPPGVTLGHVLAGQTDSVMSVAFDPLGGTLASGSRDGTVMFWDLASGRLRRSLDRHKSQVHSVAFDPQGGTLASGSGDKTVKLWDVASGQLLRSLEAHWDAVFSVAFDRQGGTLASGSLDDTVKLWDVASGRLLRSLEGHQDSVRSVAFDRQGGTLASGSADKTVKLWDVASGQRLRTLEGHRWNVLSVAFDRQGGALASGSDDNTVKLWDVASGRLLRTLEGHTGRVDVIAFSPDGSLLASKSNDHTVRLWSCATWETLAIIPVPKRKEMWIPALAFHPDAQRERPLLSTASSPPNTPNEGRCREIHLFELDREVLLGRSTSVTPVSVDPHGRDARATAHLKTAKVVLVGDTGVGKSAMAERLVNGQFVLTESTHARRALTLQDEQVPQDNGTVLHRRTALWDLAGQPAYRLVHQLSMDDAAVACVLFNARSATNPFEGPAYWAEVLKQARTRVALRMLLVAARVDVGGLPASLDRIHEFAAKHGFAGVFQTSAKSGEGCPELLAEIKQSIPWDDLPSVSTPHELASLREFLAQLKGETTSSLPLTPSPSPQGDGAKGAMTSDAPELLSIADLRERFLDATGLDVPMDKFVPYLQRLEDCDEIDLLVFHSTGQIPQPEDLVLLDPTRVDAYASALLVAAKDEPNGPGHLLESRIRDGNFKLEASERLTAPQHEKHVLWYVMEYLFQRELALREEIAGEDYAVFPSQCTTQLAAPGGAAFGVAIGLSGPVSGIYATLIAQLAHYAGFPKREFFEDAAAYHTPEAKRCLVRLRDNGNGTGEIEVSFDNGVDWKVRQGFLEFVEKHVEAKAVPGSLTKRHAHHCGSCGKPFDDSVVCERLKLNRVDLNCPYCDERTRLVNLLVPATTESTQVVKTMEADAKAGRQRITAEWVIKAKEGQGKYDVFLSHNSKDKDEVEAIARKLMSKGIRPWFDKWDLAPGDILVDKLEWAIDNVHCALLCFGQHDAGKWHIVEYRGYLDGWANKEARMIPVILPNAPQQPDLPPFLRQALWVDMRNWRAPRSDAFARLQCGILGKAPGDAPRGFSAREVWEFQGDEDAE
jgi:small GTP-binding protein